MLGFIFIDIMTDDKLEKKQGTEVEEMEAERELDRLEKKELEELYKLSE